MTRKEQLEFALQGHSSEYILWALLYASKAKVEYGEFTSQEEADQVCDLISDLEYLQSEWKQEDTPQPARVGLT